MSERAADDIGDDVHSDRAHASDPRIEDFESTRELRQLARGEFGSIPESYLADHVAHVYSDKKFPGIKFPVRRAALGAVMRCCRRLDRVGSVVDEPRGTVTGFYRCVERGDDVGMHTVRLRRMEPLVASCDCREFTRNSLGLCPHVAVVLHHVFLRSRGRRLFDLPVDTERVGWTWQPIAPLHEVDDPLARIRWVGNEQFISPAMRRRLRPEVAKDDEGLAPTEVALRSARRRRGFVRGLQREVGYTSCDPALRTVLSDALEEVDRCQRLERCVGAMTESLEGMRTPLYPYQRESVERFFRRGRALIADDMGLGKTAQAIGVCHAMWKAGAIERGLLLVPASLKPQWLREWTLFSDVPATILDGNPAQRRALLAETTTGFLIGNYEQLWRDLEIMRDWSPDLVVLDEAQRIKNCVTKTAVSVKALDVPYRLALSGTPFQNRLRELASVIEWIDDRALAPSWRLEPSHLWIREAADLPCGIEHLRSLRERLGPYMVRRVRAQILHELPKRTDHTVSVQLTPLQHKMHDRHEPRIRAILEAGKKRALTREEEQELMMLFTMQRMIANGLAQVEFDEKWPEIERSRPTPEAVAALESSKLVKFGQVVRELLSEPGRKVVVFSQWRRMLKLANWSIGDVLEGRGVRAVFFSGEEGRKQRQTNLVDFHDDPNTRVLFATDAGGTGLNLQRAADCCINLELPWNPAVLEQRVARIHRIGQTRPIDVHHFVTNAKVELRIGFAVGYKRGLFDAVLDGSEDRVELPGGPWRAESGEHHPEPEPEIPPEADQPESDVAERCEQPVERVTASAAEASTTEVDSKPIDRESDHVESSPRSTDSTQSTSPWPGVRLEPRSDGGLRLEADPEQAAQLASMFEAMATLLRERAKGS